jgi:hypothetical protein
MTVLSHGRRRDDDGTRAGAPGTAARRDSRLWHTGMMRPGPVSELGVPVAGTVNAAAAPP